MTYRPLLLCLVGCATSPSGVEPRDCSSLPRTAQLAVDTASLSPVGVLAEEGMPGSAPLDRAYATVNHQEARAGFPIDEETVVDVSLQSLALGEAALDPSHVTINYRFYPASQGPRAPDVTEQLALATGTVDVYAVAMQAGETTCGTFELTADASRHVEAVGWFSHVLELPQPGL